MTTQKETTSSKANAAQDEFRVLYNEDKKYLESIIHLDLEELEVLRDIYENFMDNFHKELLIMDHVIAFKKTSLGLALC